MILKREKFIQTMSCCCCYDAFFLFFLFSFLTSFMASTQNLTCLYHGCPNTMKFDSNITSTPPSPVSSPPEPGKGGNYIAIIVAIGVPIGVVVLLFVIGFIAMRTKNSDTTPALDGDYITTEDSLQLDFRTIQSATHDFSESNKLGEGEFGKVYKGTLFSGVDIAVKRLAKGSGLSEVEFKNEVALLAKLQHINLVRLLGFCLEGEERILVYECLSNKSLDLFVFDPAMKGQLNWSIRYKIIVGIAQGILYLHQDSQVTVIHSNLKASNILLDDDMNPKLADFGMARLIGTEQSQDNMCKIVGQSEVFMKSDVNSFGVLLLEIISGRNISSFHQTDAHDLITYAWRLWRNGTPLDLVDPAIGDNYQRDEVTRAIQIGLLCVQEDHRPMFPTIVMMLTRNTSTLPEPREPGCPFRRRLEIEPLNISKSDQTLQCCVDADADANAAITNFYPR